MEQLRNAQEIAAARRRLVATFDGWEPPYAHGVALIPGGASGPAPAHFARVNREPETLHCAALAEVTGHRSGTAAYELTRSDLQCAIAILEPAEAFVEHQHPNLWTWRDRYLPALDGDPGARLVAVFLGSAEIGAGEAPEIQAFRAAVAAQST